MKKVEEEERVREEINKGLDSRGPKAEENTHNMDKKEKQTEGDVKQWRYRTARGKVKPKLKISLRC